MYDNSVQDTFCDTALEQIKRGDNGTAKCKNVSPSH